MPFYITPLPIQKIKITVTDILEIMQAKLRYPNLIDDILPCNRKDFDLVKEMLLDINPVSQTVVKSYMCQYFEINRIIYNI